MNYFVFNKSKKYLLLVVAISLVSSGIIYGQTMNSHKLYGRWKVKNLEYLQMIGNESAADKENRVEIYNKILAAEVKIDSLGLRVFPSGTQDYIFENCDSNMFISPVYLKKKVVFTGNSMGNSDGSEMIDSNIVNIGFVHRLDTKYQKSFLLLLDTKCKEGFGDFTAKICILDNNLIAIFTGANLIILNRYSK
jgi:hypothetical protein